MSAGATDLQHHDMPRTGAAPALSGAWGRDPGSTLGRYSTAGLPWLGPCIRAKVPWGICSAGKSTQHWDPLGRLRQEDDEFNPGPDNDLVSKN